MCPRHARATTLRWGRLWPGPGKKYESQCVRVCGGVHSPIRPRLKPRPNQGPSGLFSVIRCVDARSLPVQTRLTEPTGDHTTIRFEGVVLNGPMSGSAFDLKLPSGVEEVK